jgi:hypothetical protein
MIELTTSGGPQRGSKVAGNNGDRRRGPVFARRRTRLGLGIAAGAFAVALGSPAFAECTANGTTLNCSGDVSGGVTAGPPYDTLNVTGVTTAIAPALGTHGVDFEVNGPITLTVDTGTFGMTVTGLSSDDLDGASGIVARGFADGDAIGITANGAITSGSGYGIFASGQGDISDESTGAISAGKDAIHVEDYEAGGGTVTINHTGNLTSSGGNGVSATTQGNIDVTTDGAIQSALDGLHLQSFSAGTIDIDESGDIGAGGYGIFASTQGSIDEESSGTISSAEDGIHAQGYDVGDVSVDHTGAIASAAGNGVWADTQGNTSVTVHGAVTGGTNAIYARTSGLDQTATVIHDGGTLTANGGDGIKALAPNGSVSVTNSSDISATGDGIYAETDGAGAVGVSQTGQIKAARGIVAYSSSGPVDITDVGDVETTGLGISGISLGGAVSLSETGSVTSSAGKGIVLSSSTGDVTLSVTGDVSAKDDAISATSLSFGEVDVTADGTVSSANGKGIYATSAGGGVHVTAGGLVSSQGDGITASTTGPVSPAVVEAAGVTSSGGAGIIAHSASGSVYLTDTGVVEAHGRAIEASSLGDGSSVNIWQTGDVTSDTAEGIAATAGAGAVSLNAWGNVTAATDGIIASNLGSSGSVSVLSVGNVHAAAGSGVYAYAPQGSVSVSTYGDVAAHGSAGGDIGHNAGIYAASVGDPNASVEVTANGSVSSDHGDAIYAASTSSKVTVTTNAVVTGGKNGINVSGDGGDISVDVEGGSVSGGDGASINITGPSRSAVTNKGVINLDGLDADAIVATNSETAIDNYGTINGNITLSTYTSSIFNWQSGLMNLGSSIDLGNLGNFLDNAGSVAVGGAGNIATTTLNGAFRQETSGVLLDDVDPQGGTGDMLDVTGEANLSGKLRLNLTSFGTTTDPIEFLSAGQWINTRDITATANPTVLASVSYSGDNKTAYVSVDGFNFAPEGVSGNAASIGSYLNTALPNTPSLAPVGLGLANLGTIAEVDNALDQLTPTIYNADQRGTTVDDTGFVNRLFSCKVADGADPFNAEGECTWARADYGTTTHTGAGDGSGYSEQAFDVSAGRQVALGKDVRLDIGGGVVSSGLATDLGSTSKGATGQFGAALKYVPGDALLAASLSGSYGWFQNQRPLSFGGFTDTLKGNSQLANLDARLRAAYTFQQGDYYARPQIDLDASYAHAGAVDETGAVAAMHIDASDELALSVTPAFEVGGQTVLDDDSIFRPYLRGGATVYADPSSTTTGHFVTDTGGDSFSVASTSDQVLWNLSAGFDLLQSSGQTWRAYYDASFGATTLSQSGGVKLSVNY